MSPSTILGMASWIRQPHGSFVRLYRRGGPPAMRIVILLERPDAIVVAPLVAPVERLYAVPLENGLALVGFVGEKPVGIVTVLDEARVAALGDATEVVLISVGGRRPQQPGGVEGGHPVRAARPAGRQPGGPIRRG